MSFRKKKKRKEETETENNVSTNVKTFSFDLINDNLPTFKKPSKLINRNDVIVS